MPTPLEDILRLEVPVIVLVGERRLTVQEVSALAPGAIVELPKKLDEDLEVLVNNMPIGHGRAVKVGENFGVRVTGIGDRRARIRALAAETAGSAAAPAEAPAAPV